MVLFQDAIKETLSEMDPEASFLFMEKFGEKISKLKLPETNFPTKPLTQEKKYIEAEILSTKINELEGKH